jgi:hypothetical protein
MNPIRVEGGNIVAFVGQPNSVLAVVVTDEGRVMSTALSNLKVVKDDPRTPEPVAMPDPTTSPIPPSARKARGASAG